MAELLHEIRINAAPQEVLRAIVTQPGLRSWWTADSVAEPKRGAIAEFGFNGRATVFRMQIAALTDERVVWECLGEPEEWRGTQLEWRLLPVEGGTSLRFTHRGWRSTGGMFAMCNTTWGELMHRLRDHVEGRNPGPLF